MVPSSSLEYIETIEPTLENAKSIVLLTLQDLVAGAFKDPLALANPSNPAMVAAQQKRLRNHPERYSGFAFDGSLVAYMKQNHWTTYDELPFAPWSDIIDLLLQRAFRMDPHTGMWGVFGLVASDTLSKSDRDMVLTTLLESSFGKRPSGKERIVNIVLHKNDPLLEIVPCYGFVPYGRLGQASGAPGAKQRRFRRLISS